MPWRWRWVVPGWLPLQQEMCQPAHPVSFLVSLVLQIKSLQANLQRLRKVAAGVKSKSEQTSINELLSETASIISGVGPGGDL